MGSARRPGARPPRRARASPGLLVRRLEEEKAVFGDGAGARKLELLRRLAGARLGSARDLLSLHESLCFLRAYPDDAAVLAEVERMLEGFAARPDLRRHRRALQDTGIVGTETRARFFAPIARWLVDRWPEQVRLDWGAYEKREKLERVLPLLAHPAEAPGVEELALTPRQWLARMKGPGETDAAFLIRRLEAVDLSEEAREIWYDDLDPALVLRPGPGTPSRTLARLPGRPVVFQSRPLRRARPDLEAELAWKPRQIRTAAPREAEAVLDLAREAMATRDRDLDVFSYGDPRDVRLVDCGDGLEFALIGARPERRLLLEAVYGFLTLQSGVPIGYVLSSALFGSSEIAFNVFETWRGGESAWIYARVLALVRRLFGASSFTIFPYQLGDGNDEALDSGAWWFYRKLGFEPRDPEAVALMRSEERRLARRPSERTGRATLARLARSNLFLERGRPRPDVIGRLPLPNLGLHVTRFLSRRFGSRRAAADTVCGREAARLLGLRSLGGLTPGERVAWCRWAPLVLTLPGIEEWSSRERRELARVIRAKGGRRESAFVTLFDRHRRLRRAIRTLAETDPPSDR